MDAHTKPVNRKGEISIAVVSMLGCLLYAYFLFMAIRPYWFNPQWTTDDATQQIFPFHAAVHPGIFQGDFIYEAMRGYLAAGHFAIGYAVTWLTRDAVMTGHWLMLGQLVLISVFIVILVYTALNGPDRTRWFALAPAFFALFWFLHSQQLMQRLTGGLQRGWAPVVFLAFLLLIVRSRFYLAMAVLVLGCLLNPPAAFLCTLCCSLYLLMQCLRRDTRAAHIRHSLMFACCVPLIALTALYAHLRPASLGTMATLPHARHLPEFQRAGGRFDFLPFPPVSEEIARYAFTAFTFKLHKTPPLLTAVSLSWGVLLLAGILALSLVRRKEIVPLPLWVFAAAAIVSYFLARIFAFRLFVPDRYLTYPLGLFFILSITIGLWKVLTEEVQRPFTAPLRGAAGLVIVAILLFAGQGSGMIVSPRGISNFNYSERERGAAFVWMRAHVPENALIAGEPTYIDPVQLFGIRRGYATSETWHPFYSAYNREMKRRLELELRAHYARDPHEFVQLTRAAGITHFVFDRAKFRAEKLRKARYFEPFNSLVKKLTQHAAESYLFAALPIDNKRVAPYCDDSAVVVDVAELEAFFNSLPSRDANSSAASGGRCPHLEPPACRAKLLKPPQFAEIPPAHPR